MLRQVFIIKDDASIYRSDFGKALEEEGFKQTYKEIAKEAYHVSKEQVQTHDYFKYRISYLSDPKFNLIFLFVTDFSDKFENVKKELEKCKKEFLSMFESVLDQKLDAKTFTIFDPTIESIHKNLRPKLSLVGFSGVGKTTITKLIMAEEIPMEHIPTITGDIATIKIGKLHFHLWDFAGQEQFSFLWNNFIKGSDAVLLITDSSLENCEKSKYFTELIKKEAPFAHTACIGNKQDLPDAMPIADIERHLGMKSYSMVATDANNRDKMITIIADVLEMSAEVSPLLKPLLERDRKVQQAEKSLESGDFVMAMNSFDEVADLCMQLGDDRVSQDFHEKAQKIRTILRQSEPQNVASIKPPQEKKPTQMPASTPEIQAPTPPSIAPSAPSIPKPPNIAPPVPNIAMPPSPSIPAKPQINIPPPPASVPSIQKSPPPATAQAASAGNPQMDQLGMLLQKLQNKKSTATPQVPKPSASVGVSPTILSGSAAKTNFAQMSDPILTTTAEPIPPKPPVIAPSPPKQSNIITPPPQPGQSAAPTAPTGAPTGMNASQMVTDMKIKIANLNKTLLDLEMQNITGELSDADYKTKSERLIQLKTKMEHEIKELGG